MATLDFNQANPVMGTDLGKKVAFRGEAVAYLLPHDTAKATFVHFIGGGSICVAAPFADVFKRLISHNL